MAITCLKRRTMIASAPADVRSPSSRSRCSTSRTAFASGERGEIVCRARRRWRATGTPGSHRRGFPPRVAAHWRHRLHGRRRVFYLVDRKNDMLISAATTSIRASRGRSARLRRRRRGGVVGLPDEKWGDRVHAVVAGRDGLNAAAVLDYARNGSPATSAEGRRNLAELPKSRPTRSCGAACGMRSSRAPLPPREETDESDAPRDARLAVKKHATPEAVADAVGLEVAEVGRSSPSSSKPNARRKRRKYLLTPPARMALDSDYSRLYSDVRAHPDFKAATKASSA